MERVYASGRRYHGSRVGGRARLAAMGLTVCAGCFEYTPHAADLEERERDLHRKARERVQAAPAPGLLRFAVVGDIHLSRDEAHDLVADLNTRQDLAFVVELGDFTHFGTASEFRQMNDIFERLAVPYFVVVGIHDLLGNGEAVYRRMFGPPNDTFTAARTRFVLFDSNSLHVGFDGTVPDLAWLASQLEPDGSFDRAVLLSHVPPGTSEFDPQLDAPYAALLRAQRWIVSFHAHEHAHRQGEQEETPLYVADSIDHRSYLVATVGPAGSLEVQKVEF